MKILPLSRPFAFRSTFKQGPLFVTALFVAAGFATLRSSPQQASQAPQYIEKSYPVLPGNEWPDKNAQMQMRRKQNANKTFETANLERKHQIDTDTEELVRLARELKSAVDKPADSALSTDLTRKAELIERLAHGLKEKMKLTVSGT